MRKRTSSLFLFLVGAVLISRRTRGKGGYADKFQDRLEEALPTLLPFPFNIGFVREGVQRGIEKMIGPAAPTEELAKVELLRPEPKTRRRRLRAAA